VSPLQEVLFDIFTFKERYTVYLIDQGSRAEFIYKKSALQQFLIDCNTASFPVESFVQQLQFQEDKGINAAAVDSYFKDNGIRQQVKIIYGDNACENDSDSLNLFLTRRGIRHLSSIAGCQFQNGLAENGGWVLACGVRHDLDLSGLGLCSRNSASLSTHNDVTSCLTSLSADVHLSQFYFPQRLLHCTFSSRLVVTPPSSSQRQHSRKKRNQWGLLASILEPLCLVANLAISSGYHLKNVSE